MVIYVTGYWMPRSYLPLTYWPLGNFRFSSEIALGRMSLDGIIDNKSTSVLAMPWCRQATSHNLIQCQNWIIPLCGVTRRQLVDLLSHESRYWITGYSYFELSSFSKYRIACTILQHDTCTMVHAPKINTSPKGVRFHSPHLYHIMRSSRYILFSMTQYRE